MDDAFDTALSGLRNGDFSRLAPLFAAGGGTVGRSRIVEWHAQGLFLEHPAELAEALTCACFLGERETLEYLLAQGLAPSGGSLSGMSAAHVAASRGHVDVLRVLLRHGAPLEVRNMYGGTVLAQAVWSAVHQPMAGQRAAIEELVRAGANRREVELPTGDAELDALLSRRELG
ncbi:MAG: ankyrin repeat domain-containing protein [Planctomycetes bacterium]|nr:ankyrin repeat domain-containing protein [Planctomycetota bacterium]